MGKTIEDLKGRVRNEKGEMDEIESQINTLKAKYELKRLEVHQLNSKLDEKTKIMNEAKKAYSKVRYIIILDH
jgi:chromosome segregation ATPase